LNSDIPNMEINIPITQDLSLMIADGPSEQAIYPTTRLKKGLLLRSDGADLAEESVGFGLPVLKRGLQTFFPGDMELDCLHKDSTWVVTAIYTINLTERIVRRGTTTVDNKLLYLVKNSLAALIRNVPFTRGSLIALSIGLRRLFGWGTTYEKAGLSARVGMTYTFDEQTGILAIEADLTGVSQSDFSEVVIMNEQGGLYFDQYRDSRGVCLSGNEIGCWDETIAEEAGFVSSSHRVAFTLPRVPGARLFRGRELIDSRLAWAGFGYSFPATNRRFIYTVRIEKLP